MTPNKQREIGQYYTDVNPFNNPAFREWHGYTNVLSNFIIEPFAGDNSLVNHLKDIYQNITVDSYDIDPQAEGIVKKDSLKEFPAGYKVCVTNPPWLAKNSAKKRNFRFPKCAYDDLYKFCLSKCLQNCMYVAALVPESFITSNLFLDRLQYFVSINKPIFNTTTHPVGLALFGPELILYSEDAKPQDCLVYRDDEYIGPLKELKQRAMFDISEKLVKQIKFNDPNGSIGLIALDNTVGPSIRFCEVGELKNYKIEESSRAITKISVPFEVNIDDINERLNDFREFTHDLTLTAFRGLRKDGKYRRRLDWRTAARIIIATHTNRV